MSWSRAERRAAPNSLSEGISEGIFGECAARTMIANSARQGISEGISKRVAPKFEPPRRQDRQGAKAPRRQGAKKDCHPRAPPLSRGQARGPTFMPAEASQE